MKPMIGRFFNALQIDEKEEPNGTLLARYSCVTNNSKDIVICAKAVYGMDGKIQGIYGEHRASTRSITNDAKTFGFLTETSMPYVSWFAEHPFTNQRYDKQYPSILECYFVLPYRNAIIPISSDKAIYIGTRDASTFVTKTPVIYLNRIIGDAIKLPNNVTLDLVKRTLLGERSKLRRFKGGQKPNSPSLDEAIRYLDSQEIKEENRIPSKVGLKGSQMMRYHLAMITVIEHLIKRIENDRHNTMRRLE